MKSFSEQVHHILKDLQHLLRFSSGDTRQQFLDPSAVVRGVTGQWAGAQQFCRGNPKCLGNFVDRVDRRTFFASLYLTKVGGIESAAQGQFLYVYRSAITQHYPARHNSGELTAWNVDVETQGNSSAAIRSDRGGGTLTVEDGSYVTNGTGSPAIYSTAQIAVTNAVLTANRSEAIVVEGRNSVTLTDCTVSGNMQGTYGPDSGENLHGVMLYQSMSGDAQEGQSLFRMTGGELTTLSGDLFYVTNTDCAIELSGVALTLADGCLLRVEGNTGERGWGTPGENGGRCTLNAIAQALSGTIRVDESSSLDMTLSDGATFEGTVNPEGQGGEVNVTLAQGCRWTLTADAYVTSFTGDLSCVETNGYTLYTAQEKPVAGV